jgi:tetratricopeptide (TPR) repeat protein
MSVLLSNLAYVDNVGGHYEAARRKLEESVALSQGLGDARQIAAAGFTWALVYMNECQFEKAEQVALNSVALHQRLGDARAAADVLRVLGLALHLAGRYAEAQARWEEWVAFCDDSGVRGHPVFGWLALADVHQGCNESARAYAEMAMSVAQQIGAVERIGNAHGLLARLAVQAGAYQDAKRLAADGVAVLATWPQHQDWQRMTQCILACAELGLDDREEARHHMLEVLQWTSQGGWSMVYMEALPVAALLLLQEGQTERAVEIYALASTYGYVANSQWYEDVVGLPIAEAAAALPPEVVIAARERGRARDVQATLEELIEEWEE